MSDDPTPLYIPGTVGEFTQFSEELNATGKSFDNKLSWVGGLFFMNEKNHTVLDDDLSGAGIGLPPLEKHLENDTKSYVVYAQGTYRPVPELGLTLGGRYTREDRSVDVQQYAIVGGALTPPPSSPPPTSRPSAPRPGRATPPSRRRSPSTTPSPAT